MRIIFNAITLLLIMDPLGNIPPFLSVLKNVEPQRRRSVLIREIVFAYIVLLTFLFLGKYLLRLLSLQDETISIAGGIVLFLIALRMVFPSESGMTDKVEGEPFIVPLAIPLIAGPSILASLLLLQQTTSNIRVTVSSYPRVDSDRSNSAFLNYCLSCVERKRTDCG